MDDNTKNKPALSGEYVKNYYNAALGNMNMPYADFRWFSSPYAVAEYKQTKQAILHALGGKKFDSVLEIGGGDGVWTELLLDRSNFITEMDISEEMLRGARKKFADRSNMEFICGDFLENKLSSGSYDLIYAIRCFEYFPDKQRAISEMHRLLKSGGVAVIVTKNPDYITIKRSNKKILHRGQMSPGDFVELLSVAGFIVEDVRPAILGKKFDILPARIISNGLHALSLSRFGWIIPNFFKKYFSESYLVLARKV